MLTRTILAISTAIVLATPAMAKFENDADFGNELGDFFVSDATFNDGIACNQEIDVLDGYKAFLGKEVEADSEQTLLFTLTGVSPDPQFTAPLPVVACN
ncbi:hypothetical protein N9O61_04275 [Octadecabacter sp.]|nr:hypothetical protein [Octadecabacter sp.]